MVCVGWSIEEKRIKINFIKAFYTLNSGTIKAWHFTHRSFSISSAAETIAPVPHSGHTISCFVSSIFQLRLNRSIWRFANFDEPSEANQEIARGSRVLAGKKTKNVYVRKCANTRYTLRNNLCTSWAEPGQVPDVGGELRIFAVSDTAFIAFGKDPTGNLTKRFKMAVSRGENSWLKTLQESFSIYIAAKLRQR